MRECPYCLEVVEEGDDSVVCRSCGAVYHSECWFENGGCCVKSCESAKSSIELDICEDDNGPIVITSEAACKAVPHKAERRWNPCLGCGRHVPSGDLYCRECKPKREPSEDVKNTGPLLIMLALLAVVVGAVVILGTMPVEKAEIPTKPGIETKLIR